MIEIFILFILAIAAILVLGLTLGWSRLHYRTLSRDIEIWQKQGWVSPQGARAILDSKRPAGVGGRLVFLVGLLGAFLLLFAAISFVAANWDDMSRLSRLALLLVLLWVSFLAGWRLIVHKHPLLGEIAWSLGLGLFGVNIALIAQMFHIDSHPPNGVFMWSIGALVVAALLQSRAALLATFTGGLVWSLSETIGYNALIHWSFLLIWLPAFALSLWRRWAPALHMAFLSFIIWLIVAILRYAADGHWAPHGVLTLFVMFFLFLLTASLVLQTARSAGLLPGFENWLEKYAVVGLLPALFILQTIPLDLRKKIYSANTPSTDADFFSFLQGPLGWLSPTIILLAGVIILLIFIGRAQLLRIRDLSMLSMIALCTMAFALFTMPELLFTNAPVISKSTFNFLATWIYGAIFLAMLIWLIEFGHRRGSDLYVWVALATFAAEVLYIYFRIFGSLLETSLFFFTGGILTLGLAFFLTHLHKRLDGPPLVTQPEVSK